MKDHPSRVRHLLFTVASTLSLLLCITAVVMWIWTAKSRKEWTFWRHGVHYALVSRRGSFGIDNRPAVFDVVQFRSNRMLELVQGFHRLPPMTFEEHQVRFEKTSAFSFGMLAPAAGLWSFSFSR